MANPPHYSRSTGPALLAALAIGCEAFAWAWLVFVQDGAWSFGPACLAGLGVLGLVLSGLWLARRLHATRLALCRVQDLADGAARHQVAMHAAQQEAVRTRQLMASSLDTLDVGLEIYDEHDRLVMYNKRINLMHPNLHTPDDIGKTFVPLVRANIERGLIPAAIGREEEWLTQRMATRGTRSEPLMQELADDQWVHTYETRTPEGYLVAVRVDVTDLVRKSRALEESNRLLAQQSITDGVTGIGNRSLFDQSLATEWQRAVRNGTALSLLLVDVDHFKPYNDHYGHVAGDEALRRVAQALGDCVRRAGELVARYGGEEFVMLLPGASLAHAVVTAQQCLERLQQEAITHAASPTAPLLSCSIGVASLNHPEADQSPDTLVNAADAAMYRAKTNGRARFEIAQPSDWDIAYDTPRTNRMPLAS
ncbi:MAG: diguanylate cyclase [Pseudomonadota bacterium]